MDALMGIALFGAGMTAGGGLIVSYYRSLKGVQDSERRIAARNMDAARRYNEAMRLELDNTGKLDYCEEDKLRLAEGFTGGNNT